MEYRLFLIFYVRVLDYVVVMRSSDKKKFKKVAKSKTTSVELKDKLQPDVEYFFRYDVTLKNTHMRS